MKKSKLLAALLLSVCASAMADMPLVDGEVRKVDLSAKKITIKHGEIKNLDMPPMTMVFQVKDPAMLDKLKAGDKVQFTVEDKNGAMTVLTIAPAPK
jgi:Cu/Ag efflux protein CusF